MTVLNEFTFLNGVTAPCYSKELLNNAGGGLVLAVSDGFDGSITVQGKQNGEWYTLGVVDLAKAGTADAITAAGSYSVIGVAGFSRIRLNLTAVSGTATVSGRLTTEPGTILAASSSESGGGGGSGDFKLFEFEGTIDTQYTPLDFSIPTTYLFEGKYLTTSISEHNASTYNMYGGMLGEGDFAYWYPQFSDENGNFQGFTLADTSVDAEMVTIDEMPFIKFKNNARIDIVVDAK